MDYTDKDELISDLIHRAEVAEAEVARLKGETHCAYCGESFPLDVSCEEIGNHIQVCPKHPMRVVEHQLEEMRVAKVWMEQKAAKFRDQCDAERKRASELGAEVERLREAIKTAHADGASALVASFENTDSKARVCELEAEVARLKQATARAYPDSVAQIVEGIKVYPQPTKGEVASEREALERRVRLAVNEWCSCGGRGPDDEDACSACHVLHMVFEGEVS